MNLDWLPHHEDKPSDAARAYAEHGWPIFPLHGMRDGACTCGNPGCGNPGKHPRTAHGFKDASADVRQVDEWVCRWPDANWGWAPQAGVIVLDEDPRHGGHVERARLEREHGPLPFTLRQLTGSDGFHWVMRVPQGVPMVQAKIAEGLDTRIGGSGYIVIAPSLHKSGKRYRWHAAIDASPAPAWLIERVRKVEPKPVARTAFVPVVAGSLRASRRERFARGSLAGMAKKIAGAGEGNRNEILNWAWHKMGGFADVVPKSDARAVLLEAALACGLNEREALKVLR